ncbi:serine hydroxymethyltransferase [Candidatus Lariskella endosymbiont of Epinotia ramella]|uniref:serine hydroxymethyltransferase n=1 Tax=Candidatus Lariskella endosymbiont of Epinotia ramella TaxID=3066224 RepID=UPI0030CD0804
MKEILQDFDIEVAAAISKELNRQRYEIELIASENIVSPAVLAAQGSVLTNKYAEGYPGKRYYAGCEYVDVVENLAIERAKALFGVEFANVQPHSGSQANQAAFMALLKPYDVVLSLSLNCGGHLTHGSSVNQSGKWFNVVHYGVSKETGLLDYDQIDALAHAHKPKLIIAGYSAYPREIDFAKFREIADGVGAYLMVDMAHIAGLIACGVHPTPVGHAHVITSTTHKTLRGPRGGLILMSDPDIASRINSAVFPGLQGGPLMHVIAAKAVAFKEALSERYRVYIKRVVENASVLSSVLIERGYSLVSGGTDNHLMLLDLRGYGITGVALERALCELGLICNKNSVPFDEEKPWVTSGVRLGTPAVTTRGMGASELRIIGAMIADVMDRLRFGKLDQGFKDALAEKVIEICTAFPIYGELV